MNVLNRVRECVSSDTSEGLAFAGHGQSYMKLANTTVVSGSELLMAIVPLFLVPSSQSFYLFY